ncbi:KH domain protein [Dictyocaulus viviparus]|uniref:KH domain protein n=1 Tax=Dictyocaulus viviparus TaxID=29172 RepID=A0A0D8X8C1_DICVI|nr:KH domain protein [Dictyocaulus viviparus]
MIPQQQYRAGKNPVLLSNVEPRIDPVRTFFDVSEDFVEFFSGRTGMHEILLHEDMSNIDIKLQPHGIIIVHPPDVTVRPIEMSLWKFYYDVEFIRCLRLSVLNSRCPASQALVLNPTQYALLHESKLAITRDVGLTEVFMDEYGRVCLYGSIESVVGAYMAIKHMFNRHGLGDPKTESSLAPSSDISNNYVKNMRSKGDFSEEQPVVDAWTTVTTLQPLLTNNPNRSSDVNNPQSPTNTRFCSTNQSCPANMTNGCFGISSESECTTPASPDRVTQRTSIRFFVRMSDAPRLIGTRGATKRRIENVTGCTILLHTEKKENSEFPIEVFSTSARRCEIARQHILGFLAGTSTCLDHASPITTKSKEIRVRPKVHLDISPKKMTKKNPD